MRHVALLTSLFCVLSALAFAQEPTYFGYHPMSPMALGRGVSVHDPGADYKKCVIGIPEAQSPGGASDTKIDMLLVTNSSQLREALKLDLQVDASYLAFKGGVKFNYSYESLFNDHSMVVTVTASSEYPTIKLSADAALSDSARALLKDGRAFAAACGTHYVSTERPGSSVSAIVSISGMSSSEKKDISAEMNASGGWGPLSASAAAKFQQQLSRASQSGRARIQVVATGGEGFAQLGEVVSKLSAGENSLPAITQALNQYMKQFNAANSGRIGFWVRSMRDFGWDSTAVDLWSDYKARRVLAITDRYRHTASMIDSAQGIVAGTDARSPIVTDAQKKQLPAVIVKLEKYLGDLGKVHATCTKATPDQAESVCEIPPMPAALSDAIPDLPPPPNGYFNVAIVRANGSTDTWDSVESRSLVYDRPKLTDRVAFLRGEGFLEAVRVQQPGVKQASLVFALTGSHIVSAAMKSRDVTGAIVTIGAIPLSNGQTVSIFSSIDDQGQIRPSADFIGKMLTDAIGTKPLADKSEFYLDVRDRLGRTIVVPVAHVVDGTLEWAR